MERDERFARWLDEGAPEDPSTPDVAAAMKRRLADPNSWDTPPEGLFDSIWSEIGASTPIELERDGSRDEPVAPRGAAGTDEPAKGVSSPRWNRLAIGIAAAAVLVVAFGVSLLADRGGDEFVLAATELAPSASAVVAVTDTPSGFEFVLDVTGLDPAPPGFYYQAWVRNEAEAVTIGTFHAREGGENIILWSGVDVAAYPTMTVTLQEEGAGSESSGQVVLAGTVHD